MNHPTGLPLDEGVRTGPAQQWGGVRLVPLLRSRPVEGLRLHPYLAEDARDNPDQACAWTCCYVPHAYVVLWDGDTAPSAAYGTQLLPPGRSSAPRRMYPHLRRRQVRESERGRARFLPLRLALDGLLSLNFGGPEEAWWRWSRSTVHAGLSQAASSAYLGGETAGLAEALRVFEVHPDQCGVAVHVADALLSVHLYPHPDDYRTLHPSLLLDMFGESLYVYGLLAGETPPLYTPLRAGRVRGLSDLRAEVAASREATRRAYGELMLDAQAADTYTSGPATVFGGRSPDAPGEFAFELSRFLPSFSLGHANHVGEVIRDGRGRTAYLKTFRLSPAQTRRGYLLRVLDGAGWDLDGAARALGTDRADVVTRLERARLEHLLDPELLARHRAARSHRPERRGH
ncbi:hypothetical protein ABZ512_22925 [Nocardiopsis dassonvillei]|uniref:ARPP-2 domain-containing protein n=1 Tax=Nocardiopsis dassonvillei TaxID=2014 RepID=UPI0033C20E77